MKTPEQLPELLRLFLHRLATNSSKPAYLFFSDLQNPQLLTYEELYLRSTGLLLASSSPVMTPR